MVDPSWQISDKETSHHGKSIAKPANYFQSLLGPVYMEVEEAGQIQGEGAGGAHPPLG